MGFISLCASLNLPIIMQKMNISNDIATFEKMSLGK